MTDNICREPSLETVLLQESTVLDCAVLLRAMETGIQRIAYIVSSGPFAPARLHAYLQGRLPAEGLPDAYVPVAALPLTADGYPDQAVLARLPVYDADLVQRWEERLRSLQELNQAAVVIQEKAELPALLPLSQLLPDWQALAGRENDTAVAEQSQPQVMEVSAPTRPALSSGGPLQREATGPVCLAEILERAAQASDRGAVYVQSDGSEQWQSYRELWEDAQRILAGLRKCGLKPQDKVIFQLDRGQDFVPAFWGCILGGFVPVPISIAPTYQQLNAVINKLYNAWQMLERPLVLASTGLATNLQALATLLDIPGFPVQEIDALRNERPDRAVYNSQSDDLALLPLTSGSTGMPKAVMLNHRNLLSMSAGTVQMNGFSSQDVTLNWMPLDHPGAIVFLGIMAVTLGCQQIHVPTEWILRNPLHWLELIERHKASISWAPNFAFSLINERAEEIDKRPWDLSSLRFLVNAGEQIVAKTARHFLKLLHRYGLPDNALRPAFGMSETCSGITWSAGFTLANSSDEMSFVELGRPIPGASLRILGEDKRIVAEGVVGRLQVKGLSVTSGYYRNPERNREVFSEDGWFDTGDLGYLRDGHLILTGRDKDDIVINGINYYSHEIEAVVEELEGVEISYTAACAVRATGDNSDKLALFFVPVSAERAFVKDLIKRIRGAVVQTVGINPEYLIPVTREVIPKTAIGKIQRAQLSHRFGSGEFDAVLQQFGVSLENPNTLPDWFYRRIWRRRQSLAARPASEPDSTLALILLDRSGLGKALVQALARLGQTCITVEAGLEFQRLGPSRYGMATDNRDHYRQLLAELTAENSRIGTVWHLWTYGPPAPAIDTVTALETALAPGVYSLLYLTQAMREAPAKRLLVVSSGAQWLAPDDKLAYERAMLPALVKTISQEIPALDCRHIDFSGPTGTPLDDLNAAYAGCLLKELGDEAAEQEVVYHDGHRWVPRLEKLILPPGEAHPLPFKEGGRYLITGGLGGIGAEIAAYLLKTYRARLLLIGRTALPGQESGSVQVMPAQRFQAYQQLLQLPGEVCYRVVDVGDLESLQRGVAEAESRWRCTLDGVIHLAGVYREHPWVEASWDGFAAVLRPKVLGTWALYRLLEDRPEVLLINFSSVNSFFGGAAVAAFAAASRFLDSFSLYQRQRGRSRSYCFNWSLWNETGMNRHTSNSEAIHASGYLAIGNRQGLASLLVGLRYDQGQLLIGLDGGNLRIRRHLEAAAIDRQQLTGYFTAVDTDLSLAPLREWVLPDRFQTPSRCHFLPLREMPLTATGAIDRARLASGDVYGTTAGQAAPTTAVEQQIARIWQDVLGLAEVGLKDNFFELGGHSLLLIQAQSQLQKQFKVPLSIVDMFKYPTVEALAHYLGQAPLQPSAAQLGYDRARLHTARQTSAGVVDIAVIGLACRFPGADTLEAFWQNLRDGVESITFFTAEEIAASGIAPELLRHPHYVKASPVLSDVESFDAEFFGYSTREAEWLDPQQRLLLECAWESLEDAGYNPLSYQGIIGMYAGATMNTYLLNNIYPNRHRLDSNDSLAVTTVDSMGGFQIMVANDKDYLTTRVSYKLNLRGPSVNVQTACSTSLVAIHMAVQSLRVGECDMALAGGVSVQVPQKVGHLYQEGMIVSPDGHCRAFDARAEGTIFGSGVGMVVLKRLSEAQADGDHIYAVIKGSAVNNDGGLKVGYMAPSGDGQAVVTAEAIAMAGIEADTITYMEAHGTGTVLGDPIEVNGLTQAFQVTTAKKGFCALGSVKTNVGHLQIASGVAGFIKTALALYHRQIPPSLHFTQPNPQIDFATTPFYVNTGLRDWQSGGTPRRAGVNSLGIGGTNVHVVLQEAPPTERAANGLERPRQLLALSARNETALEELVRRYRDCPVSQPEEEESLADICFTANTGRAHFDCRLAVSAHSLQELQVLLTDLHNGAVIQGRTGERPAIAFLFTGQGSQYPGMGRLLYETQPTVRKTLDRCDEILRSYREWSLLEVLYADADSARLDATAYTQPALFALEYALAELWQTWGIQPAVVIGHSVGEYVAACVAGVFSLEEGLKLIAERGRLMQTLPQDGAMVAVLAGEARVADALQAYRGELAIAAVNGPESVVISGRREALARSVADLEAKGIKTRPLAVSHAFHSPLMEPMVADFARVLQGVKLSAPRLKLVSNLTGELAADELASADYWCRHVREPVRFAAGMGALYRQGCNTFIEIGPQPHLLSMGRQCLPESVGVWLPSLRQGQNDWQTLLHSLGELYVRGAPVDWAGFDRDYRRQRVSLPTYPFQRQRYWLEPPPPGPTAQRAAGRQPLLDKKIRSPLIKETLFETRFHTDALPFLSDHRVYGRVVASGACHIALLLEAAELTFDRPGGVLEEVFFPQALIVPEGGCTVQLVITPQEGKHASFQLISLGEDAASWAVHATGRIAVGQEQPHPARTPIKARWAQHSREVTAAEFLETQRQRHIHLGPHYQWVAAIRHGNGEAVGRIQRPEGLSAVEHYPLHPGLIDAGFSLLVAALAVEVEETFVPFGIERVCYYGHPDNVAQLWGYCRLRTAEAERQRGDIRIEDDTGQVIIEFIGFEGRKASREVFLASARDSWQQWLYQVEWQPQARWGLPPDYLPAPPAVGRELQSYTADLAAELAFYRDCKPQMDALSTAYLVDALTQLGWEWQPRKRFSPATLATQLGVADRHRQLLNRLLEILAEEGIVRPQNGSWEVSAIPKIRAPQAQAKTLLAQYPAMAAELTLLARCGARLAEVLKGQCDPLELLFPGNDLTALTRFYQDTPCQRLMNSLLHKVVSAALLDLPQGRLLRLVEIGAGTGGTTAGLLPDLPAEQTDYVFTDVSPLFVAKAQEKFAGYPFVRYQTLDIEQPPAPQGFVKQGYDIVIAAHVVHATRDLGETLEHIKSLLAPGGWLVLLESTARQRWVDLTFGLTEGWWRFTDRKRRPDHPLLGGGQWQDLLKGQGFAEVAVITPDEGGEPLGLQQATIVAQLPKRTAVATAQHWLIFADGRGIGRALASGIEAQGGTCTLVYPDQDDQPDDGQSVRIAPDHPEDYQRIVQGLSAGQHRLYGVVHGWSLAAPESAGLNGENLEAASRRGCGSLLLLVQALAGANAAPALFIVTQGAMAVANRHCNVAQAPIWGMGKVIALEQPELRCTRIDLDTGISAAVAADMLLEELAAVPTTPGDEIALRDGMRYVARLVRKTQPTGTPSLRWELAGRGALEHLPRQPVDRRHPGPGEGEILQQAQPVGKIGVEQPGIAPTAAPVPLPGDVSYLITGGLGGLGLAVARWLVERGARHLVLVGRHGPGAAVQERLAELTRAGAEVSVAQADVADSGQLARVLAAIPEARPLRGVIHAAGVLDDGMLRNQTWERFARVLAPKVQGAWHLHTLTREHPLDFFVLFSSVAALFGSPGQANHAAANAFLDALAGYRRSQGLTGLSINWGAWSEIGAAALRKADARMTREGLGSLSPPQGLQALEWLLTLPAAQIGVVPVDWARFAPQWTRLPFFAHFKPADAVSAQPTVDPGAKLRSLPAKERRVQLIAYVQSQVAQVLGSNASQPIGLQQGFFEFGIDSLTLVELRNRLQTGLGCPLPSTVLFTYPTVEELVNYLFKEIAGPGIDTDTEEERKIDTGLEKSARADNEFTYLDKLDHVELEALINRELEAE